jgi:large subunit ribosomal protein L9
MKVILTRDVASIGRRHAVVEVPDGYARNKLIPMGAALPATKEMLAKHHATLTHEAQLKDREVAALKTSIEILTSTPVVITMPANEQGHLFRAVTKEDISAATVALGAPVPSTAVVVSTPIKTLGDHDVTIVSGALTAAMMVRVVRPS